MKTLNVNRPVEDVAKLYTVSDEVAELLNTLSITQARPPKTTDGQLYDGSLPDNISNFPDHQLEDLLKITTEWKNYINGQRAWFDSQSNEVKAILRATKAYLRKSSRENTLDPSKKYEVDDDIEMDARYQDIQRRSIMLENMIEILKAAFDAADADCAAVSRCITRRGQDRDGSRRVHNVGNRRSSL